MLREAQPVPDASHRVWKALADPTRRRILDRLRVGPETTGGVAAGFRLTRFGVMKHLKVLEEAGLVLVERRGRERWNHVNPAPIRSIYRRWIRTFEEEDADRLLRLKRHLERRDDMSETETAAIADLLVEVVIEAPVEQVWKALVEETTEWWHPDFYTAPGAKRFVIQPRLDGWMFEDWGDGGGQLWGRVIGLGAPTFLQVVGDSSKDWGGPARSFMTWRLEAEGEKTRLRLEHSQLGRITEATRDSLTEGWELLFRDCMKPWIETGARPDAAKLPAPECDA